MNEHENFYLKRARDKGCPLSPLLFIFILEVLLNIIQECKEIRGLKIGKYEFKYRAYACS